MKRLRIFLFSLFMSETGYAQPNNQRVRVANASQQPFRNVCLLKIYRLRTSNQAKEIKHLTGFLISPTFMLTCAHNVMEKETKVVVYPFVNESIY